MRGGMGQQGYRVVVGALVTVASACASSVEPRTTPAPDEPCTTGAAVVAGEKDGAQAGAECPMRCGATRDSEGFFREADLPAGACGTNGMICDTGARAPCPGSTTGPANAYFCECSSGAWACFVSSRGGRACPSADGSIP